jgi:hypothetical protein
MAENVSKFNPIQTIKLYSSLLPDKELISFQATPKNINQYIKYRIVNTRFLLLNDQRLTFELKNENNELVDNGNELVKLSFCMKHEALPANS